MKKIQFCILLIVLLCLTSCHEHKWIEADCTTPMRCEICGKQQGENGEHEWIEATYDEPKTCAVCGKTEGSPLPMESYSKYFDNNANSHLHFYLIQNNSADGIQFFWADKYIGEKTVNYYTTTFEMRNPVGDLAYDSITHKSEISARRVGPVNTGEYCVVASLDEPIAYCSSIEKLYLIKIKLEFDDGTSTMVSATWNTTQQYSSNGLLGLYNALKCDSDIWEFIERRH